MASRGVNKAIIVGNLGNDPEMRYLPSGVAVTSISVATSESWNDKQTGQPQERTEWHRIEAFGKLAEIMGQYLRKGSQVYIEGSIRTDRYTDQQGIERFSTKIRAENMQMLGGRQGGSAELGSNQGGGAAASNNYGGGNAPQNPAPQQQQPAQPAGGGQFNQTFNTPQVDNADDFSEDIPF